MVEGDLKTKYNIKKNEKHAHKWCIWFLQSNVLLNKSHNLMRKWMSCVIHGVLSGQFHQLKGPKVRSSLPDKIFRFNHIYQKNRQTHSCWFIWLSALLISISNFTNLVVHQIRIFLHYFRFSSVLSVFTHALICTFVLPLTKWMSDEHCI